MVGVRCSVWYFWRRRARSSISILRRLIVRLHHSWIMYHLWRFLIRVWTCISAGRIWCCRLPPFWFRSPVLSIWSMVSFRWFIAVPPCFRYIRWLFHFWYLRSAQFPWWGSPSPTPCSPLLDLSWYLQFLHQLGLSQVYVPSNLCSRLYRHGFPLFYPQKHLLLWLRYLVGFEVLCLLGVRGQKVDLYFVRDPRRLDGGGVKMSVLIPVGTLVLFPA